MHSASKRTVTRPEIEAMAGRAFGATTSVARVDELTDGMFNAAYDVELASGEQVVLKVAPGPDVALLQYEAEAMKTEIAFYEMVSKIGALPLPALLHADTSRDIVDSDYVFLSRLSGRTWQHVNAEISPENRDAMKRELGRMMGRLHCITGPHFGYMQDTTPRGDTWREAFIAMMDAVLDDSERYGVTLPLSPSEFRSLVATHAGTLDDVHIPALLHFDMWVGNIFVHRNDGGDWAIEGVIDGERAYWGDPVAELVAIALFTPIEKEQAFLAGYAETAPQPLVINDSMNTRLALYRTYMNLLMIVEAVPRAYGPEHDPMTRYIEKQVLQDVSGL